MSKLLRYLRPSCLGDALRLLFALCLGGALAADPATAHAANLSLTSTNDYIYTTPVSTNLSGIGMGPNADYLVPRAEDISFLREALMERTYLMFGPDLYDVRIITNSLAFVSGKLSYPDWWLPYATNLFQESYGNWKVGTVGWSTHADFVSDNFSVTPDVYETSTNYFVNGVSTDDGDLAAFVDSSCAVSASLLSTNSTLSGAPRSTFIAGVYSNIVAGTHVIHRNGQLTGDSTIGQTKSILDVETKETSIQSYTRASYTYTGTNGTTYTSTYYTGYALGQESTSENHYTNDVSYGESWMKPRIMLMRRTYLPYTYKINDYEQPTKYKAIALDPFHNYQYFLQSYRSSGKPRASGAFLSMATNYTNSVSCLIVMRVKVEYLDTYEGDTTSSGSTNTEYYVMTNNARADLIPGTATWEVDFDIFERISPLFEDSWVAQVSWPTVDVRCPEYTDDVTRIPVFSGATHTREIRIRGIDLNLYFHFSPVFNARILP